jgi:TP901 family phage tail tape measure protein
MKMGKEFEFAMAKIEGLVGINKAKIEQWSQAILDMGKKTSKGPLELADTLYYVASSGFKTNEALRITEMSAKGAATGLGETKDIANFLTSAMNAYRASGLSAARAMDILTASVREGKGEPNEMARALGTILPIAAELGVSLDQVGGALASMTLITSSTSNAATYLRNVLMKLMHPSVGTQKALKKMGSSVEELLDSLKNKGLMPTLMRLRELTDKYGISMSKVFPNIRALLGALNLTGQNMKYNEEVMKQVTESMGDFDKAFFIASQTLQFRWNAAVAGMKAELIRLGVTIAKAMLPVMERWVNAIKNVIDWFNELGDGTQRVILFFARLLVLLGPLSLLISVLGIVIGGLTTAITTLGISTITLNSILLTTPWVALAGIIAACTIELIKYTKASKELKNVQKKIDMAVSSEAYKLKMLFDETKKMAMGSKERADGIREINERYGFYLKSILKETSTTEELAKAYDEAGKALTAYIKVKESMLAIEEQKEKTSQAFAKYLGDYVGAAAETLGSNVSVIFQDALMNAIDASLAEGVNMWQGDKIITKFYNEWVSKMKNAPNGDEFAKILNKLDFKHAVFQFSEVKKASDKMVTSLELGMATYKATADALDKKPELDPLFETISDQGIKDLMYAMKAQDQMLSKMDEDYKSAGMESDIAAQKIAYFNEIIKDLAAIGGPEAVKWMQYMNEKLRAFSKTSEIAGEDVDDLSKIIEKYREDMKGLEYMNAFAKSQGKSFDYVGKKIELMEKSLEDYVSKGGGAFASFTQELNTGLANMETNTYGITEVIKNLGESFKALDQRKKFEVDFDVNTAKLKDAEDSFEKLLQLRADLKNAETTMVTVDFQGNQLEKAVPIIQVIDDLIAKLYTGIVKLRGVVTDEAFYNSIDVLNAQAEAYDGLAMKIEVVEKRIENFKTELSRLSKIKGGMQTQRWQDLILLIQEGERAIISLQNTMEKNYFKILYDSLGAYDDKMQMVATDITSVETRLKQLAAAPNSFKGWQDEVDNLIAKLGKLRLEAEKMESIKSTFSSLGSIFQDIGTELDNTTGDWIEWIGKVFSAIPELIELYTKYGELLKTVATATQLGTTAQIANTAAQTVALPVSGILATTQAFSAASVEAQAIATKQHTNELLKEMMTEMLANKIKQVGIVTSLTDTAAKGGEAVAGATASGAKMPFPINLVAIALGIAAVIAALATAIPKPRKMATGGVIPAGFPNDSFPAMLTSGEEVIPNGNRKRSNLNKLEKTTAVLEGNVVFVIKEDKLEGILNKANKRKSLV